MKVILALGNPGSRYAATRHNIGWMVADALAERLRLIFKPGKGEYYQAQGSWKGIDFLIVKPTTYMNNSGLAAAQIAERLVVSPPEMLAIVDEIQFPVGRVQLKSSGSSGGHNGTESIIYHLDSADFPRLRCGIGSDFGPGEMADYVLSPFRSDEAETVAEMVSSGCEAALIWIEEETSRAMNLINTAAKAPRPKGPDAETSAGRS
ncbi:MAG: peptidyl-tRNA hydrolase [Chlorobi bacterium]|nr:peptidyl-tRNA hydrolase [Chlorobiota bacterium]